MLDPRTILVAIPCGDGRNMCETTGSLVACAGLYAAVTMPAECSHVSLVRNLIAGSFLESSFEWLVCIDSDIAFSREDFQRLLEPCDSKAEYYDPRTGTASSIHSEGHPSIFTGQAQAHIPSRKVVAQCIAGKPYDMKIAAAADVLVVAEYPYKSDEAQQPVRFGMGFVRIHRSVFETLRELKHDGGPTVEVQRYLFDELKKMREESRGLNDVDYPRQMVEDLLDSVEDRAGQPRLWQMSHKGVLYTDFYPSGPILSQFVPTAEWKAEDHGFFTLCMLAGITPRVETRSRLTHIGRKAYQYQGPDEGAGQ